MPEDYLRVRSVDPEDRLRVRSVDPEDRLYARGGGPVRTMSAHSAVEPVVASAVRKLRQVSGVPVTFGGPVAEDRSGLVITELCGTNTQALLRLQVGGGQGLGGKALTLARPAMVHDYPEARGITHHYDHAVARERLRAVVAIPIRVNRIPRAVVYAAARHTAALGDAFLRKVMPVISMAERDLQIEEEVRTRLSAAADDFGLRPAAIHRELGDLCAELAGVTGAVADQAMRSKLEALCDRFASLVPSGSNRLTNGVDGVTLAPREREVLAEVATGGTNEEIARTLGLRVTTVKSYLKNAMRKLDAANRVHAVHRAREVGLLP